MSEIAYEAETIINFNEEESKANVYTASKRVATLLERRGLKPVMVERPRDNGELGGWWFEVPKTAILIKPGKAAIKIGGARKINSTVSSVAASATSGDLSA